MKLDLQDCSHTETTKCKVIVVVGVGRFFNCICNAVDDKEFEDTNGEIKSVNRRRTNNTMAKRKRTNNEL